jgi:hypothetical protein
MRILDICYGIDKRADLLEIQLQRLIDNGFSNKEAISLLLNNKCNLTNYIYEDSLIHTTKDSIYRHSQLQIHSEPGGFDPVTCTVINRPYYLEMRDRYTMTDLLEYYYRRLLIPIEFRDKKRDEGAFNHILSSYKLNDINTLDLVLFTIDYSVSNNCKISNPLELKNYIQLTYESLANIINTKLDIKYREELLDNEQL